MSNLDWGEITASGLSLFGLFLGFWGALLVAFPESKSLGRIKRFRLILRILFPWSKTKHGPIGTSSTAFGEIGGWRLIIWSFLLQVISMGFRIYQLVASP